MTMHAAIKFKKADELKPGDVMLMSRTAISFIPATVKLAEAYANPESALVHKSDDTFSETVISYEITVYGKRYEKKLVVPDTDIVLVVE